MSEQRCLCEYCGASNDARAPFCRACGGRIERSNQQSANTSSAPGRFHDLYPKGVPVFKCAKPMMNYDVKKGQEMIDALCAAFEKTYGPNKSSQQAAPQQSAPAASIPLIPSGNRYAGHEELVSRIARDIVNEAFSHVRPIGWVPVSCNTKACEYSLVFGFEKDRISVYCDLGRDREHKYFYFIDYGMKQLPDVDGFASAIEPFIKKYGNDAVNRAFANIDKRSSYSMKCGSEISHGSPCIYVLIKQVLHPDNNLTSW